MEQTTVKQASMATILLFLPGFRKPQKHDTHRFVMGYLQLIASAFNAPLTTLEKFAREAEEINSALEPKLGGRRLWAISKHERVALYCVTRLLNPRIAVETGVGSGVSTTFILSGLENGVLHSFDLGAKYGDEQQAYPVGFIIPEELKKKWVLHVGDSKKLLGPFFDSLKDEKIQLFLHDGEHTYTNVHSELTLAWTHMDRGAILIDNCDWTQAPEEFAKRLNTPLTHLVDDMCMMLKAWR